MTRVVWVAAGGTAGHINAALSVIEALNDEVVPVLITTDRSLDHEVTAHITIQTARIQGVGFARGLPGVLRALGKNVEAFGANVALLWALPRPERVVSFGGFHTPLVSLVGRLRGARSYLLEQNAALTRANRLVGVWSARVFLAWPVPVPKSWLGRSVVVGNPPRAAVVAAVGERARVREALGFALDEVVVVVTSGSLGARSVNAAAREAASLLAREERVSIVHAMGSTNGFSESELLGLGHLTNYRPVGYDPELYRYLVAADLVVARAGASTLTEIALCGVASILIPLPGSPNDHQQRNAEVFARAGASIVLEDGVMTGRVLADTIGDLVADGPRRCSMGEAARRLAHPDAAKVIWEEMERV
ncbi:MAG: UDP-N-acetylglucosamine--N-acetylmuramyl-(pentapeptide) pyrophosphoryl-undecaprenol N-acetylglucosamine transferase [Ferrimicrobium sp.]|uniref:Glycosyltransferase n=1 Tax=Ferrimicrobium acidiphilum TaxID=121039 RepID=A0ABV3Y3Z4_9ACTN